MTFHSTIKVSPTPQIERLSSLHLIPTPLLGAAVQVWRAVYRRLVPTQYLENPYTRPTVDINVLLVPGGRLVIPSTPQSNLQTFFEWLKKSRKNLFYRLLSPGGTAKAASTEHITPIKEITHLPLAQSILPGEEQLYGWHTLAQECATQGLRLQILFQGNGLYFNRGSAFFDGEYLLAYPDRFLAELSEADTSAELRELLAIEKDHLKRPMLFFIVQRDGRMAACLHHFESCESFSHGLDRLQATFRESGIKAALAASPALIIPGPGNEPIYLTLPAILSHYHANDVRHSLYCPYEGAVLLSAELGRAQCLQPVHLARSLSGRPADRIPLRLTETLRFVSASQLGDILDRKAYAGRYASSSEGNLTYLHLNPLEGVYSHLLPFLTRDGQFGLIQTSGTRGTITGNDGPTIRQLVAILRDLNTQPPFARDPIVAAASGAQGNDVPNIVCASNSGNPGMLHRLAPQTALDEDPQPRGQVTTPRVGIAI